MHWVLSSLTSLLLMLVAACSSGGGGGGSSSTTPKPTGSYIAGGSGALVGIGSYDLASTSSGYEVQVYGQDNASLGVAQVVPEAGAWIASFAPADGSLAGYLEVWSHDGDDGERVVTYRIRQGSLDTPGLFGWLVVEATWHMGSATAGTDPSSWELARVVLQKEWASDEPPPALGGVVPTSTAQIAQIVVMDAEDGTAPSRDDLLVWASYLGIDGIVDSRACTILVAMAHDGGLAEAIIALETQGAEAPSEEAPDDEVAEGVRLAGGEECSNESITAAMDAWRHVCTEKLADECVSLSPGGKGSLVDYFLADHCQKQRIGCLQMATELSQCIIALETSDCAERFPSLCTRGLQIVGLDGECSCTCGETSCATYCGAVADTWGLELTGPAACESSSSCTCPLDAAAYCQSRYGAYTCGPGTFDEKLGIIECDTAACNDGGFSGICAENPSLAEVCDSSTPDGELVCGDDERCLDCECVPCEYTVECGDGEVSDDCPGYEEECDGEGQAQCPDGYLCELCGCVEAPTAPVTGTVKIIMSHQHSSDPDPIHIKQQGEPFGDDNKIYPGGSRTESMEVTFGVPFVMEAGRGGVVMDTTTCVTVEGKTTYEVVWAEGFGLLAWSFTCN